MLAVTDKRAAKLLAAITGHSSQRMVAKYAGNALQKRRAMDAQRRRK